MILRQFLPPSLIASVLWPAVAVFALNLVLRGITELALQSRLFNASLGIRHHHELIRKRTGSPSLLAA